MVFIYLSIGLLLVLTLHTMLLFLAKANPQVIRKALSAIALGAFVLFLVLLVRFGLAHLAAILGIIGAIAPLVQRFRMGRSMPQAKPAHSPMTVAEAREILDVDASANATDIRAAHKRLIHKNHPDAGGTEYLASKVNEARDVLLAHLKDNPS